MSFTEKWPLELSDKFCEDVVGCLHDVDMAGVWPQRASTTLFFVISKNVTSETSIPLLPTLTRWLGWLGAPVVAGWARTKL